jgi:hypothetical protein
LRREREAVRSGRSDVSQRIWYQRDAAEWLARLLAEAGDLDELRTQVDAGADGAGMQLVSLMIKQGRRKEAARLRRFGLNPDGSIANE